MYVNSEHESPINESGECIAFMARTNPPSVQSSSDSDSKSNEDFSLREFSYDEQDLKAVYRKLLKDSMCLSRINDKMSHELKVMESQNSSITSELEDARPKVGQL